MGRKEKAELIRSAKTLQGVRAERYKYIHYTELEGMDEMYDLETDPYKMHNVIGDAAYAKQLDELRAKLSRLTSR